MKLPSILYRNTGKLDDQGRMIREPVELSDAQSFAAFTGFSALCDDNGGIQTARLNAAGNTNDTTMGFQVALDTATYYRKQITEQTFYTVKEGLNAYVPMTVGEGAWSESMLTNRSFSEGGAFSDGIITDGGQSAKLSTVTASMATISQVINTWGKKKTWSIIQVQKALRNNNWDFIYHLEVSRKTNYDLGVQEVTFLGLQNDTTNTPGLLNNPAATVDTSTIPTAISAMTAGQFSTLVSTVLGLYFNNTNNTTLPNKFVIPMSDYLGLSNLVPGTLGTYPMPMIQYLLEAFRRECGPDFQIMGVAYAQAAINNTMRGINKNIYMLYRHDMGSLIMNHPVPYMATQPGTQDNFTFSDVGFAQFTGVLSLRPLELYQMQY